LRVQFDNCDLGASTGPNTFARRLATQLFNMGHEVVLDDSADVSLVFIEPSGRSLAKKVVQRLDGIWFKPHEFETKNAGIKALYDRAAAVVFQSQFDQQMVSKHWGAPGLWNQPGRGVVIRNGIELDPIKQLTIPKLAEMRQAYERIYVCSSNWHAQKRLEANVRLFEHLRLKRPSSCLIIMGGHPDYRATGSNVFYTGSMDHETCSQIYSAADWMLHLAWADHCPNVIVEALAQGTPVACAEVGGTKELIGSYGVVLKEAPYGYELADYDNPPAIDVTQVDDLPTRQELNYSTIADIDIRNVAQRYVDLFQKVIG
jgi:glycosyltransferase involved in cell wall biosynthesis